MWGQEKTVKRYLNTCGAFGPWTSGIEMRLLGWSVNHRIIGRFPAAALVALIIIDWMERSAGAISGIFRSSRTLEEKKDDPSRAKYAVGSEVEELQRPSLGYEL